jgi:hypothetical protein
VALSASPCVCAGFRRSPCGGGPGPAAAHRTHRGRLVQRASSLGPNGIAEYAQEASGTRGPSSAARGKRHAPRALVELDSEDSAARARARPAPRHQSAWALRHTGARWSLARTLEPRAHVGASRASGPASACAVRDAKARPRIEQFDRMREWTRRATRRRRRTTRRAVRGSPRRRRSGRRRRDSLRCARYENPMRRVATDRPPLPLERSGVPSREPERGRAALLGTATGAAACLRPERSWLHARSGMRPRVWTRAPYARWCRDDERAYRATPNRSATSGTHRL